MILARRYATGLAQMIDESSREKHDEVLAGLEVLHDLYGSQVARKVFKNPGLSDELRQELCSDAIKGIGIENDTIELLNRFVAIVVQKRRTEIFEVVAKAFEDLLDEKFSRGKGEIYTAERLDQNEQEQVKVQLEQRLKRKLIIEFKTNPSLLGGMLIKIGHLEMDMRVSEQLKKWIKVF